MRKGENHMFYVDKILWKRLELLKDYTTPSRVICAVLSACLDDVEKQLPTRRLIKLNGQEVEV